MRRIAYAIFFAAVLIVIGSSSCTTTTGHGCKSAGGTCLFLGGGGPTCLQTATQASAQDCTSANAGGWICCLEIEGGAEDGATDSGSVPPMESGTSVDGSFDATMAADGASDAATADGPSEAATLDAAGVPDAEPDASSAEDASLD